MRQDPALAPAPADLAQPEARQVLREALCRGESVLVRNAGVSMRPALLPGDFLCVEPLLLRRPKPGDLVLLAAGQDWIVHRLLGFEVREGAIMALTAGDASVQLDEPQPLDRLLGVVVRVCRGKQDWPVRAAAPARVRAVLRLARLRSRAAGLRCRMRLAGTSTLTANRHRRVLAWSRSDALPEMEISDWSDFLAHAEHEGLAPLIFYYARAADRRAVIPDPAWDRLARAYHEVLARNTLFLERLAVFIRAMNGRPVMVLKGACLAREVYPSPALRPFSDLDVLVRPADLVEAVRQLERLGYHPLGNLPDQPDTDPVGLNSVLFQAAEHEPAFHVHWHLFNSILPKYARASLDLESLWAVARPCAEGGSSLAPEHLLIHLAEHALRHSYDRLILLRDLAEVIVWAGPALDWERVMADSRAFGLTRPVYVSLALAREWAGAAVPGSVLAGLRSRRRGLGERLFLGLARRGRRGPEWSNLVYLADQPDWGARLAFLGRLLVPPRAVMARAYGLNPDSVGPGLYLRRLGRGLGQALNLGR